jgi:hypothetical protein
MSATNLAGMMSESDRARVREEMLLREEIRRELAPPTASPSRKIGPAFIHTPFFITVICGFCISLMGNMFVRANAQNERFLARENSLREKKTAIVSSFADDLSTLSSIRASWLVRKLWLDAHQKEPSETYKYGQTRDQVYGLYVDLWKMLMKTRKSDAILAEARSFFDSEQVQLLLTEEMHAQEAIGKAKSEEDIQTRSDAENKVREKVLMAMGNELRRASR